MKVTVLTIGVADTEVLGVLHNAEVTPARIGKLLLDKGVINRKEHNGLEHEVKRFEGVAYCIEFELSNGTPINVFLHETEIN